MGNPAKKYSPEVRERAVRLFQEHVYEYPSRWAAMQSIAVIYEMKDLTQDLTVTE